MTLAEAEQVCCSFSTQPLLLPISPASSLCRCLGPSSQAREALKETPSLAPDCLHTQAPPHLAHQHCQLRLLSPSPPQNPTLEHLLMAKSGTGKLVHKGVNIFRGFSPGSKDPASQWREGGEMILDAVRMSLETY